VDAGLKHRRLVPVFRAGGEEVIFRSDGDRRGVGVDVSKVANDHPGGGIKPDAVRDRPDPVHNLTESLYRHGEHK
jgi:hypothetical protein